LKYSIWHVEFLNVLILELWFEKYNRLKGGMSKTQIRRAQRVQNDIYQNYKSSNKNTDVKLVGYPDEDEEITFFGDLQDLCGTEMIYVLHADNVPGLDKFD